METAKKEKYRILGNRCIVAGCRRKQVVGRICCSKHRQTKMRLSFSRLPIIYVPRAVYVAESSASPMKIKKGVSCAEVKT